MASNASSRELLEAFNFRVSILGDELADGLLFQDCGPIESSISLATYREAGSTLEIKCPDLVTFSDVTLSRGASRNRTLHRWYQQTLSVLAGVRDGRPVPRVYLRNIQIAQLDRPKRTVKRYTLFDAFPTHIREGAWDNRNDELVIESITLTYRYYTLRTLLSG